MLGWGKEKIPEQLDSHKHVFNPSLEGRRWTNETRPDNLCLEVLCAELANQRGVTESKSPGHSVLSDSNLYLQLAELVMTGSMKSQITKLMRDFNLLGKHHLYHKQTNIAL